MPKKTNSKSVTDARMKARLQRAKDRAVEKAGGPRALGTALGLSGPAISQWDIIPPRRVPDIASITGMQPWELRPDLYKASS